MKVIYLFISPFMESAGKSSDDLFLILINMNRPITPIKIPLIPTIMTAVITVAVNGLDAISSRITSFKLLLEATKIFDNEIEN